MVEMGEKVAEERASLVPLTSMISDAVENLNEANFELEDVIVIFTTRSILRRIPELDHSLVLEFGYIPQ